MSAGLRVAIIAVLEFPPAGPHFKMKGGGGTPDLTSRLYVIEHSSTIATVQY